MVSKNIGKSIKVLHKQINAEIEKRVSVRTIKKILRKTGVRWAIFKRWPKKISLLYWGPISGPWLLRVVGSCIEKKNLKKFS